MSTGPKEMPASVVEKIRPDIPFPCTNEFFGFDPEPGVLKSAHVYYRYGNNGQVLCASAKEGGACALRVPPGQRLIIHGAQWAGRDMTDAIYALVKNGQTLDFNVMKYQS